MSTRILTMSDVWAAVLGGGILGGGGGGHERDGMRMGELAVSSGSPKLISLEDLPSEALVATVSLVGAPAAPNRHVEPDHFVKTVRLLESHTEGSIFGLITNENGPSASINGWYQASALEIPVVDAPANGRAHPTGVMGAMGLQRVKDFISTQVAIGGQGGNYVEVVVRGSLEQSSSLIRHVSITAGGLVAVARHPVQASYLANFSAVGALSQALDLGYAMLSKAPGKARIYAAAEYLGGDIVTSGEVSSFERQTRDGFDLGSAKVGEYDLTFWNEYMTLERHEKRVATFPDLIMTLDLQTGQPLITADIKVGVPVAVLYVPKEHLKLGAGMKDLTLFRVVEQALGVEMISYLKT